MKYILLSLLFSLSLMAQFTPPAADRQTVTTDATGDLVSPFDFFSRNGIPRALDVSLNRATRDQGRAAKAALPVADAYPITLTEDEYDALTEYEPRLYNVIGVGRYFEAQCIYREPWSYEAADLHVMTTGNDTTGDGSFGNPYLTISKGFDVAVTANGGTVWVHGGTYAEDVTGGYFLKSSKNPASRVYIKGRPDQHVVMTNVSGLYLLRFNGLNSNITFQNLEFRAVSNVSNFINNTGTGGSSIEGFEWIECSFVDDQATGYLISRQGDTICSGIKFSRCSISGDGNMAALFQQMDGLTFIGNSINLPAAGATTISLRLNVNCSGDFYFSNNDIRIADGTGIKQDTAFTGVSNVSCRRNRITANIGAFFAGGSAVDQTSLYFDYNLIDTTSHGFYVGQYVMAGTASWNRITSGGSIPFGFPTDGVSVGLVEDVLIEWNTIFANGGGGHGLLVGANGENITLRYNHVDASGGGSYALVQKGKNNLAEENVFIGGANNAMYVKGGDGCVLRRNVAYQTIPTVAGALDFARGSNGELNQNNSVTQNIFYISDSRLFSFTIGDVDPGNVIDDNTYIISGAGIWGSMFGTAVSSLADVQAQWAANYDQTGNDATSRDQ